jgi:uncharacterized membrane protein YesL
LNKKGKASPRAKISFTNAFVKFVFAVDGLLFFGLLPIVRIDHPQILPLFYLAIASFALMACCFPLRD